MKAKRKGTRVERELANLLQDAGIKAKRVPGSGAFLGLPGDITIEHNENKYLVEVKARANGEGFKVLEKWMGNNDFLFLKKDRSSPMVVMTWETFINLMGKSDD